MTGRLAMILFADAVHAHFTDYLQLRLTRLVIIAVAAAAVLKITQLVFAAIGRRVAQRRGPDYKLSGAHTATHVGKVLVYGVILLIALHQILHTFGIRFFEHVADEWTEDATEFLHIKAPHLLVVGVLAYVLIRILNLLTARMVYVAERHAETTGRASQIKTVASVVRATGYTAIVLVTGLQALEVLGFNLAPLLASAGVVGIAIGLAAQTIVKDVLNGVLILIEDQYKVGDVVTLAGITGTVEAMTLRKTSVRDGNGALYVIPNSQITLVGNQSQDFSLANIPVSVDFSANPDEVVKLLRATAKSVRDDAKFSSLFLEDPQVLGIDNARGSELIYLVVFKTRASQQYLPAREFRRRIRLALEEHGMLPGDPNRVFRIPESALPSPQKIAAAPDKAVASPQDEAAAIAAKDEESARTPARN